MDDPDMGWSPLCMQATNSANRLSIGLTAIHRNPRHRQGLPIVTQANAPTSEITAREAGRLMDALTEIVVRASAATLKTHFSQVARRTKDDLSPVTAADELSEAAILEGLARVLPGVPVVSEESLDRAPGHIVASVVIVDPLDGTKEFLAGRDEFTVNVGIVTHGVPVAGVIAAPAQGFLWRGVVGGGAERLRLDTAAVAAGDPVAIRTRAAPERLVAATSRSHLDPRTQAFLARMAPVEPYPCGSSVKFCQLAQGAADIYPRLAPTHEWDIAAGCAILAAAGGAVTDPEGRPLRFGQADGGFLVPGFIAWGDPAKAPTHKGH
jgi:3'(2'), 5'-bisphosphate nucleotidase